MLFKAYKYCTKNNENDSRTGHLLLWCTIYWRNKLLTWRWLASHSVSGGYSLERTLIATGACVHAQSCLTLCDPMDYSPLGSSVHGIFPGKNTRVGCHFLLQGIFPTQGSNPRFLSLLHCRQILYHWAMGGSAAVDIVKHFIYFPLSVVMRSLILICVFLILNYAENLQMFIGQFDFFI